MKNPKQLPLTTHWKIHLISAAAAAFTGLVSSQFSQYTLGTICMNIAFAVLIGSIVWAIVFVKCPHCSHRFTLRHPPSGFCPDCGNKIE